MNKNDIESKITKVVSQVLNIDANMQTCRQNCQEWDSLKHIEIMFALEDEFQIQFSEDQLSGLDSMQKLVEGVKASNAP